MRVLLWLLKAALFFALFAFALNNQHEAAVKGFFGQEWRAPMVFVVLVSLAGGCVLGILTLLPSWWRYRREAQRARPAAQAVASDTLVADAAAAPSPEPLRRDGL